MSRKLAIYWKLSICVHTKGFHLNKVTFPGSKSGLAGHRLWNQHWNLLGRKGACIFCLFRVDLLGSHHILSDHFLLSPPFGLAKCMGQVDTLCWWIDWEAWVWEEKDLITWKKVLRESKSESTVIHREERIWISICALVSNAARILMCLRLCELSWRADRTWLQSINPPSLVLFLSFFHSLTSKIFIQLVSSVALRANNILANKDLATIDHINQNGLCSRSQGITPNSPT